MMINSDYDVLQTNEIWYSIAESDRTSYTVVPHSTVNIYAPDVSIEPQLKNEIDKA